MVVRLENGNNQSKGLGVLQDVREDRNNPVTLSLRDKTTGEKFNIKLRKISKTEDFKSTDTDTSFINVKKVYDHKKNKKEQNDGQSSFVLPEIISNNFCSPYTSGLLNGYDTGLNSNHLGDYETVLLKVIADLITETNVNPVKNQSGFGVLNGLFVQSPINIKDENIIVVNSKLAKEGGVLLDIPAELIHFLKINNSKARSNKSDDEIKTNIIIKPLTLLVGDSIIKIRICNKTSTNINDNVQNEEMRSDYKRVFKHKHISTQTESTTGFPSLPIKSETDAKCLVDECETNGIFYIDNVANSLDSPSLVYKNSQNNKTLPRILDLTLGSMKDRIGLKKGIRKNELTKSNKNMAGEKLKTNIKHLKNYSLEHNKYTLRLNNIRNRIRNSKDKMQIIEICDKLIKLSKSLQIRNAKEISVCSDFYLKSVFCSSHASKFTLKKSKMINEKSMKSLAIIAQISENNPNVISGCSKDCIFPDTKNEFEVETKCTENINKENISENKIKAVISSEIPMLPKNIDSFESSNCKQIITLKNDYKTDPHNSKNKIFSNASTMTEMTNFENDNVSLVKNNRHSTRSKKKKFCTCLKKNKVKHNLMATKMNEIKNKIQKIDWFLKRGRNEDEKQNTTKTNIDVKPCDSDKHSSHEKLNRESHIFNIKKDTANFLTPILSEPLDNVKYKFSFGNPQKRHTKYTKSPIKNFKYSDSPSLSNDSSYEFTSNNVRVACDKCGIMCDLIINNNQGQFKLQLKSHICLINTNQVKKIHGDNPVLDTESQSSHNRENLFLQDIHSGLSESFETETSETYTSMETNKFQPSFKSFDRKLHDRTFKTSSSSSSPATYSLQSNEKTDYSLKTMDNVSSLSEVPVNSKEKQSIRTLNNRQENVRSADSIEIECEHCGKSRRLAIQNINGNTIIELKSHICVRKTNCNSGKLEKLTEKMIPLNEYKSLLGNKYDNPDTHFYRKDNGLVNSKRIKSKEYCSDVNGTKQNYVDRINIPNGNNSRIYESNTQANSTIENEIDSANELVSQIKKLLKNKKNRNSAYASSNPSEDYFIKRSINKIVSQKELESDSECSTQSNKKNIPNNDKDMLLQKSLLDLITIYDWKHLEHSGVLNNEVKTESELKVNNKIVKPEKGIKRVTDENTYTNSKMNFKGFILDNGEMRFIKENKNFNIKKSSESVINEIESEESNVNVEISKKQGPPPQIKLMREKMCKDNTLGICPDTGYECLHIKEEIKGKEKSESIRFQCALDEKVHKENNLDLKFLKGKRKTSFLKQMCIIS